MTGTSNAGWGVPFKTNLLRKGPCSIEQCVIGSVNPRCLQVLDLTGLTEFCGRLYKLTCAPPGTGVRVYGLSH